MGEYKRIIARWEAGLMTYWQALNQIKSLVIDDIKQAKKDMAAIRRESKEEEKR